MILSEALGNLFDYEHQLDRVVIDAIEYLVENAAVLTTEQRRQVHKQMWRITWTDKYLKQVPHTYDNPGVVADSNKSKFYSSDTRDDVLEVLKASEEGRL